MSYAPIWLVERSCVREEAAFSGLFFQSNPIERRLLWLWRPMTI